jgi:hypothetical protein
LLQELDSRESRYRELIERMQRPVPLAIEAETAEVEVPPEDDGADELLERIKKEALESNALLEQSEAADAERHKVELEEHGKKDLEDRERYLVELEEFKKEAEAPAEPTDEKDDEEKTGLSDDKVQEIIEAVTNIGDEQVKKIDERMKRFGELQKQLEAMDAVAETAEGVAK